MLDGSKEGKNCAVNGREWHVQGQVRDAGNKSESEGEVVACEQLYDEREIQRQDSIRQDMIKWDETK